jgi:cell division transport system ATP-binding protein
MVQFKSVTKIYKNSIVGVNNISFVIDPGEFVFLIGPSGSGKTTIIKMLIRDEIPTTGKIFFDDRDITNLPRRHIYKLRREIGVIFQDYKLVSDKTVYENVSFAMEAAGKTNKEIKEAVPYVLDIVGLEHRMDSFPNELSGGEQQRVAIARAIANNPKILIADEPTGNLDPASAWDIVQVLTKINSWGTTVIMSTHGTEIVNSLNKRVIQMHKGEIIRDDNEGQYEMTSTYESSTVNSIEQDKEKKPDFFSKKHKQLRLSIKHKIKSVNASSDELKDEDQKEFEVRAEKESKDSEKQSAKPVELKITLGRKGVKIPIKHNSDKIAEEDSKVTKNKDKKKSEEEDSSESNKTKEKKNKKKSKKGKKTDSLAEFKISKRLKNLLTTNGFNSLGDLKGIDLDDLAKIEGITKRDIKKLKDIFK